MANNIGIPTARGAPHALGRQAKRSKTPQRGSRSRTSAQNGTPDEPGGPAAGAQRVGSEPSVDANIEVEWLRQEQTRLAFALDEAGDRLASREREIAELTDRLEALRRQGAEQAATTEGLRSKLTSLSETLAKAEIATSTAEDVSHYVMAGFREVAALVLSETEADQANVARQLIHLWHYTVADREPVRRALKSAGASVGRPKPWPARLSGKLRGILLGFYPQLTPDKMTLLRSELEASSSLFDPHWYRERHPECGSADALDYFIRVGLPEDHDPHPLFDTAWYRRQIADSDLQGVSPVFHFLREGAAAGVSPHPLFDTSWYLVQNPDVVVAGENPLCHFIAHGAVQERSPHPAFDIAWYRRSRGIAVLGERNPLIDYVVEPEAQGATPHPLFDTAWYLAQQPESSSACANPLVDYLEYGVAEDRNPHPLFDTLWYLSTNPDAAESGLHPFVHFLRSDPAEARQTSPWFDAGWYQAEHEDVAGSGLHPVVHYLTRGRAEGRQPSPALALRKLRELAREIGVALPPLLAYVAGVEPGTDDPSASAAELQAGWVPAEYQFDLDEPAPEHEVYWLPDPLREYVMDRFGDEHVPFVREMMGIISRHDLNRAAFAQSYDCRRLLAEMRKMAVDSEPSAPIDVSIVMPVFNGLVYTLTCLRSLFEMKTRYRFEVLIGDDTSTDGTSAVIPAIGGLVRYVRHPENLGFLLNCNVTSLQAKGRYVILLNSDIIILPRWLDALIGIFASDPNIGYAGSKLLNANGTLQEAGGIFWNDGSAWNYGRNQNPRLPEFNYVKDIDYCSGAAIALPMAGWSALGGFDLIYAPAYCEDSDLAFRVRAMGQRVIYQPFAEVIHHEGKTHGTDTLTGIKAYQVKNSATLAQRWWRELRFEHYPNAQSLFYARDRSGQRPHILFIDHYVPQWDHDAGSRTIFQYLQFFVDRGFQITFWPDNLYEDRKYSYNLQQMGIEVIYGPQYVDQFPDWIATNGGYIRYVLLSRPHVAMKYIDEVREHVAGTILYYGHDLHWKRLEQEYEITGEPELLTELVEVREVEDTMCAKASVVLYPIAEECEEIRRRLPEATVAEIPGYLYDEAFIAANARRIDKPGARDPYHLLFVGGFVHRPNVDAVMWFAREVLPLLRERDDRYRLTVVGSSPPGEIRELDGAEVTIAGQVSDQTLGDLYRTAGVAVVPLRFGGGIKGKVIEAFANAVPVVTTTVGLQGIADGETMALVADDPTAFADRVAEIAANPALTGERAHAAIEFVRRRYSAEAIRDTLKPFIPELRWR